jgi:hypothetical protein
MARPLTGISSGICGPATTGTAAHRLVDEDLSLPLPLSRRAEPPFIARSVPPAPRRGAGRAWCGRRAAQPDRAQRLTVTDRMAVAKPVTAPADTPACPWIARAARAAARHAPTAHAPAHAPAHASYRRSTPRGCRCSPSLRTRASARPKAGWRGWSDLTPDVGRFRHLWGPRSLMGDEGEAGRDQPGSRCCDQPLRPAREERDPPRHRGKARQGVSSRWLCGPPRRR